MKTFTWRTLSTVVVAVLLAVGTHAQRDYTFVGLDGSNPTTFFSNANWQCSPPDPGCNVPSADDTARIGRVTPGGYDVFSPRALGAVSVKSLFILNGSTLHFTNFTTTQAFLLGDLPASAGRLEAISSGSIFSNNGMMTIPSQGASSIFAGSFNFINNGTVNSWNLFLTNGPMITNQPNASFFIHATNGFGIGAGGTFVFNNLGLLSKPSSIGTAIVSPVNLTNSGIVDAGNGILQIGGAGSSITSNCGRFTTSSASGILLLLAVMTVNPCPPFAPPGDVATNFFGPGPIRIQSNIVFNGGDVRFGFSHPVSGAITAGNVELDGASILGAGNLRLVADANNHTTFNWLNGQIGGSGSINIDAGGIFNINGPSFSGVEMNGRTVNNGGEIRWSRGNFGNTFAANTFNNQLGGLFEIRNDASFNGLPLSVINNAGVFRKTIGTGTTNIGLRLDNTGTVDVQSGILRFTSTAPNTNRFSGNFNIAGGAVVEFGPGSGGFSFEPGFISTGAGPIRIGGGANTLAAAPLQITYLDLIPGASLNGTVPNEPVTLTGPSSTFDNAAVNNILLRIAGSLRAQNNVTFNNGSTLENRGSLTAPHNTSLRQNAGGAFRLNNFANINPGTPVGTLFMDGIFTQAQTGTLNIDIGGTTPGTQHDQLRVFAGSAGGTGTATVGGTLNVNFINGFVPAPNQFFQIMTCQFGCTGKFAFISGLNVPSDLVIVPGYGTNAISLITTQVTGSVAPPVLISAVSRVATAATAFYTGTPNTSYLITLYEGCSLTGQTTIGTDIVTTNAAGSATAAFFMPFPFPPGTQMSARATDAANQTSPLSNCLTVDTGKTVADFDGDQKSDLSIYRQSNGQWWYQQSSDNVTKALTFGTATDKIVAADYDGDSKTDVAIFREPTGEWFVLRSSNQTFYSVPFGISTDTPVPADYDGDRKADVSVFRESEGNWYINRSSGGTEVIQFGLSTDIPVPADYDGDGKDDVAIYRKSNGQWWVNQSTAGVLVATFGTATDKPVKGDFTGDGKHDFGFWRPSLREWFVLRSEDFSFYSTPFGADGDLLVPADYDGDRKTDIAVFRPSISTWFVNRSTGGVLIQQFGLPTDIPVPSAYVP